MDFCSNCGSKMKVIEEQKNTKKLMCTECFTERLEFIAEKPCKHEYDDRNGNKCIQCGEPSINYRMKK